ncbi:MAG TPA: hypothetical protein VEZ51_09650 [Gemmatimonadaceae bacterium]|nr:hypothetical protein [Gemmatimonadaceae bacterium]
MADIRIPVSPAHAMVNTLGDATHPALIQLKNPAASGFNLRIYELRLGLNGTITNRLKMQRTNAPLTLGGTTTTAVVARRNEADATALVGTLKGCTAHAGTIFTEAASFWYDKISKDADAGYQEAFLIVPLSYPLIIAQGSALEFATGDANSSAIAIRLYAVWDEIAV